MMPHVTRPTAAGVKKSKKTKQKESVPKITHEPHTHNNSSNNNTCDVATERTTTTIADVLKLLLQQKKDRNTPM